MNVDCKMIEMETTLRKYYLLIKTYKKKLILNENWSNLILEDKLWNDVLNSSLDSTILKEFFNSKSAEEREEYFQFAIACFMFFIQCNFTGPSLPKNVEDFLIGERFKDTNYGSYLSVNSEDINCNTKHPVLLVVAKALFDCCTVEDIVNLWWSCRALMIHQEILDDLNPTLLSNADRLDKLIQNIPLEGFIKAELDIELSQMYLKFRHISKAKERQISACNILGLEYELIGKLGKRTKHQTEELAQLSLQVTLREQNGMERPEVEDITVPQNFKLNDDVRLDEVEFSEAAQITKLPNTEQKLLLTIVQQTLTSSPPEELQTEEVLSFLDYILHQKNTYAVRVMALLWRCKLESKKRRTIERCLKQCEEIINCVDKTDPSLANRIGDVFGTSLPQIWRIQAQYADILLNFGLVKNSLDIYLKVQLWEEVIVCYTILKMRQKAAEIIKKQLEVKPTVKLMCLLGDATEDITCFEKAWEMSKRRSHRAQRHWGQFLFVRKNYEECIPHFEKSLSINPLQANIWLGLGFAALKVENWHTAATAYRRYTTLEPDGFEAWNNLAQAYLKIGNKRGAHQAVLEALKCNFENWKIWENLLVISCDVGNFSDVIRAYHRLLELKERYLNLEVLGILVDAVCSGLTDVEGNPARNFTQKTRELVGRITALYPNNGEIWELYASLAPVQLLRAQRLQRAYRGWVSEAHWESDPVKSFRVLNICNKLADVVLDDSIDQTDIILGSVKLNISSALTLAKKHSHEETKNLIEELSYQLEAIVEKTQKSQPAFQHEAV